MAIGSTYSSQLAQRSNFQLAYELEATWR